MITQKRTKETHCELEALKYMKFQEQYNGYRVCLTDKKGYDILCGYGNTKTEALNDLHGNLL